MRIYFTYLFILLFVQSTSAQSPFVTANGTDFRFSNRDFRFVGVNAWYLQRCAADSTQRYIVDEVFQATEDFGIRVIRTWAFNASGYGTMREAPYEYLEEGLRGLDYVLFKAEQHNIKVILCIENYYADLGGIPAYLQWGQERFPGKSFLRSDFFSDDSLKQWYKYHLKVLAERKNSFTKVVYKDDPVIFGWELMNEAENEGESAGLLFDWYDEMSRYLRTVDPNHLITTGETGYDTKTDGYADTDYFYNSNHFLFNGVKGSSYSNNLLLKDVDYGSYHCYPEIWNLSKEAALRWMLDHNGIAVNAGKPALLGEYGIADAKEGTIIFWLRQLKEKGIFHSVVWQYVHPDFTGGDAYGFNEVTNPALMQFIKGYSDSLYTSPETPPLPEQNMLYQNYPNPFNPVTTIRYEIAVSDYIRLELFSPTGERLKTLDEGLRPAGRHEITLSLSDDFLPSGIYFYRLRYSGGSMEKSAVLLK
jgi:mannan endo-1,4-beta-mannosidase